MPRHILSRSTRDIADKVCLVSLDYVYFLVLSVLFPYFKALLCERTLEQDGEKKTLTCVASAYLLFDKLFSWERKLARK